MNLKRPAAIVLVLVIAAPLRANTAQIEFAEAPEACLKVDQETFRLAAIWPLGETKPAAPQTPLPAVVRVIATDRNSMSLGSGSLVDANDDYGLIVTNWHVVRDAVGPIEVVFPDGFHSMARVVRTDKEWDLAALLIYKPSVQPIPVSSTPPQSGEILTIAGYGSGEYKMQSGKCTQYLAPAPGRPNEIVEVAAAARHGDSGGPILNSHGELAGVLFGEGGGRTDGSYGGRVNQFLQLAAVDLRSLPAGNRGPANNIAMQYSPTGTNSNSQPLAQAGGNSAARNGAQFAGGIADAASSEGAAKHTDWSGTQFAIADRTGSDSAGRHGNLSGKPLDIAGVSVGNTPAESPSFLKPVGFNWTNELKSFLAAFGVAALVLNLLRWLRA